MKWVGAWAIILYFAAIVLTIVGFVVMFHYGDYDSEYNTSGSKFGHIVGGDAYNYIIIAIRGVGFILAGVISAITASTLLIVEALHERNENVGTEPSRLLSGDIEPLSKSE